jgi:Flp pilus assembly pilin Flp
MDRLATLWIGLRESLRRFKRAQTMAEYALILAGIAIVVFVAYETMGQDINAMVTWTLVDKDLLGH